MPAYKTPAERNAEIIRSESWVIPPSFDEEVQRFVRPSALSFFTIDGPRTITLRDAHIEFDSASAYVHNFSFQYDET